MRDDGPSLTALSAARHRALHQVLDGGAMFADPLASVLLGLDPDDVDRRLSADRQAARMRWFIAARSRFAEDRARAAVGSGLTQLVLLGAGLDTFAYRLGSDQAVTVFEVDHPATQAWKRERLATARIEPTAAVVYVPVDFETDDLVDALVAGGFDATAPAMFLWLGVLPSLTLAAVEATLRLVARVPRAEVVFDYGEPVEVRDDAAARAHAERARRVARLGEPWITFLTPVQVAALLERTGFRLVEDADVATVIRGLLGRSSDGAAPSAARLVHAVAGR